jgi:cyclopropane-fatty-acyl-phospholipid synthase
VSVLPQLDAVKAAQATNIHYEKPAEVFAAFLGRHMKYTCALFQDGTESLDEAQEAYLDYITKMLRLQGGERVLDVGCGWGSLTIFLAERLGCQVTAITPSGVQQQFVQDWAIRAGVADLVHIDLAPFQTAELADRSFDAVAMVEVIEHLPEHLEPLRKAYRVLKRAGRIFISASCYRTRADKFEYEPRPASMHALGLYGFTAMASLSQLVAEVEDAGFSLTALTDTTAHYGPTMEAWLRNIEHNHELMDRVQPGFADELNRYFDTATASWGYTAKHYGLAAIRDRMGSTELP